MASRDKIRDRVYTGPHRKGDEGPVRLIEKVDRLGPMPHQKKAEEEEDEVTHLPSTVEAPTAARKPCFPAVISSSAARELDPILACGCAGDGGQCGNCDKRDVGERLHPSQDGSGTPAARVHLSLDR